MGVIVAIIGIAVGVASWLRPVESGAYQPSTDLPQFSDEQTTDAENAVCAAHAFVERATQTSGRQTSDDPAIKAAVAVNIRLGSALSASYLLNKLDSYPATPPELARSVRDLATAYQETTLTHLSDGSESELDAVYERLDDSNSRVSEACR